MSVLNWVLALGWGGTALAGTVVCGYYVLRARGLQAAVDAVAQERNMWAAQVTETQRRLSLAEAALKVRQVKEAQDDRAQATAVSGNAPAVSNLLNGL